ncbi:hypothetical protein V8E54_006828 [Elaphomyces granulatus]
MVTSHREVWITNMACAIIRLTQDSIAACPTIHRRLILGRYEEDGAMLESLADAIQDVFNEYESAGRPGFVGSRCSLGQYNVLQHCAH